MVWEVRLDYLASQLDTVSGNSGILGYEERVVSNTANLQQFANSTIRPVFHYVSGNSYTGDIQLDEIYVGDGLTGNIANFTFEFVNIGTNEAYKCSRLANKYTQILIIIHLLHLQI